MLRLSLILLLFILCIPETSGQQEVWILGGKRSVPPPYKRWKPELVFDARNSWIDQQQVKLGGIRLGMEFRRVHRFGVGVYGLNNPLVSNELEAFPDGIEEVQYQFNYASIFYERVLYFNPKWEVNTALHLGTGNIDVFARNKGESDWYAYRNIDVRPVEGSVTAYYHLTWWMSLGGGVGYRYIRKAPDEVKDAYNNTVYVARLKIRIGRLVKSIWNKDAKNEY